MPTSVPFTITSPAFADGGAIPKRFTCDGANVSPEIDWSGAPVGTGSLALTVIDPDARDYIHWLIYDIPRSATGSLSEGVGVASGPIPQGVNSSGRAAYMGPCPPSGIHHYVFTLYALDTALGLTTPPKRGELEAAMNGHVRATAILTGTYAR